MESHFASAYTLRPDCTYTVNGTTYKTNANGQIESFSGPLSRMAAPRSASAQRNLPGKLSSEDASHLMPASGGGSGKVDNLVRMDRKVNQRDYAAMENENRAFLAEGKQVTLTGNVAYSKGSDRPTAIMVERAVSDPITGERTSDRFSWTNEDMGQFDDFGEAEAYSLADEFPNPSREPDYDALTDCMSTAYGHNTPFFAQTNMTANTNTAGAADMASAAAASDTSPTASSPAAFASGAAASDSGSAGYAGHGHGGPGL